MVAMICTGKIAQSSVQGTRVALTGVLYTLAIGAFYLYVYIFKGSIGYPSVVFEVVSDHIRKI
jgi:hypothetical protein